MNRLFMGDTILGRNVIFRDVTYSRRCPRTYPGAIIIRERPRLRLRYLIQIVTPGNELVNHAAGTSYGPNSGVSGGGRFKYNRNLGGGPERQGYGSVPTQYSGETSALYQDDDGLFKEYKDASPTTSSNPSLPTGNTTSTSTTKHTASKKDDWDEEGLLGQDTLIQWD